MDAHGNAVDVAAAVRQFAPAAKAMVGMSLGGLTAIALTARRAELVRKIVLVDVLPGIKAQPARHITDFVNGPASFASLDDLLERTARLNPARSRSSLRRGILHNAEQQPDGTWAWPGPSIAPAAQVAEQAELTTARYPLRTAAGRAVVGHRAAAARPRHARGLGAGRR